MDIPILFGRCPWFFSSKLGCSNLHTLYEWTNVWADLSKKWIERDRGWWTAPHRHIRLINYLKNETKSAARCALLEKLRVLHPFRVNTGWFFCGYCGTSWHSQGIRANRCSVTVFQFIAFSNFPLYERKHCVLSARCCKGRSHATQWTELKDRNASGQLTENLLTMFHHNAISID